MTDQTKIALSSNELELVCNKEWILTKHRIIDKVYRMFGTISINMQQQVLQYEQGLPLSVVEGNPKISRGENYRGLPYVMLDYPRHFTREDTLAIRTLFWWGNFFSINLHLAGAYKERVAPVLQSNFNSLRDRDYSVCISGDPWQHHFGADNYISLKNYTGDQFAAILHRETFVKIAQRVSLQQWDEVPLFVEQHFSEMIQLLNVSYLNDGKGL